MGLKSSYVILEGSGNYKGESLNEDGVLRVVVELVIVYARCAYVK